MKKFIFSLLMLLSFAQASFAGVVVETADADDVALDELGLTEEPAEGLDERLDRDTIEPNEKAAIKAAVPAGATGVVVTEPTAVLGGSSSCSSCR